MNAHRINKGENIDMRGGKDSDFFFATKQTNQEVVDTVVQYCKTNLPRYYHVDPLQDIQVLTPMHPDATTDNEDLPNIDIDLKSNAKLKDIDTVSYTHLDVYKRQG